MENDPRYLATYQAAYEALMADPGMDAEDRDVLDRAIAALARIIRRRAGALGSEGVAIQPAAASGPANETPFGGINYDGLSVAEAAAAYLSSLDHKEAKTGAEIINHLTENGYEFATEHPNTPLSTALRRRAKNYRDVIQVGRGKWGLREWYTQKEITDFTHKERTIAGMEAARARGKRWGKALSINETQAVELKRLLAEGRKHGDIGEIFGVGAATIGRYKKMLENWSPGDPYPPSEDENSNSQSDLDLEGERSPLKVVK